MTETGRQSIYITQVHILLYVNQHVFGAFRDYKEAIVAVQQITPLRQKAMTLSDSDRQPTSCSTFPPTFLALYRRFGSQFDISLKILLSYILFLKIKENVSSKSSPRPQQGLMDKFPQGTSFHSLA
jgi:hypothetical protein